MNIAAIISSLKKLQAFSSVFGGSVPTWMKTHVAVALAAALVVQLNSCGTVKEAQSEAYADGCRACSCRNDVPPEPKPEPRGIFGRFMRGITGVGQYEKPVMLEIEYHEPMSVPEVIEAPTEGASNGKEAASAD